MLLVMPGGNSERLLRASFRLSTRVAHGLHTPVLTASGRLRSPDRVGVKGRADRPPPRRSRAYMDSSPAAESFSDPTTPPRMHAQFNELWLVGILRELGLATLSAVIARSTTAR